MKLVYEGISEIACNSYLECFIAEGVSFQCSLIPFDSPSMILQCIVDFPSQEAECRIIADLLASCIGILMLLRKAASLKQGHVCSSSLS